MLARKWSASCCVRIKVDGSSIKGGGGPRAKFFAGGVEIVDIEVVNPTPIVLSPSPRSSPAVAARHRGTLRGVHVAGHVRRRAVRSSLRCTKLVPTGVPTKPKVFVASLRMVRPDQIFYAARPIAVASSIGPAMKGARIYESETDVWTCRFDS